MSGRLIAHAGAEYIDREGLRMLETPQGTDTWTPIPHYDLVVALEGQLKARNINIVKEQFAVQKAKLFGVLDTNYQMTEEGGASIGIRTANDKSLALQLAIGYRVFICDNMAFHGDLIALKRKHTANLDLHTEFALRSTAFSSPRLAAALAARHPAPVRSVPCGAGRRLACRVQRWPAAGAAVGGLPVARGEKCV